MAAEKELALQFLESEAMTFFRMSDRIWGFAEPAFREYRSSKILMEYLKTNGFKVDEGISGMPTVFSAGGFI